MKYFYFFLVFVFPLIVQPRFALAQSSPDDDVSNKSEIEEEATSLGDLNDGKSSPQATSSIEEELRAVEPYEAPIKEEKKHSNRVISTLQSTQPQLLYTEKPKVASHVKRQSLSIEDRITKAQLAHAKYQAQLAHLQKEIADLKANLANRASFAATLEEEAAKDQVQVEKARKARDELKKQTLKARKLHVAYETSLN